MDELQNLLARYKAGGALLFVGGKSTILILVMFIAAPFILIGSLLVELLP